MANPYLASPAPGITPPILTERNFMKKYEEIDSAIRNKKLDYLLKLVKEDTGPVNLSQDPLLSVVIAYEKSDIAIRLIDEMSAESMMAENYDGDTALHVAAAKGDVKVAAALAEMNPRLLGARNKHMEIPLHKAALFGEADVFWILVHKNSPVDARREDGATMLHCAIMGNAPELALQIAEEYPEQMTSRNSQAVTPLQLVVTIPEAFRSQLRLGSVESLIYAFIPLEERCHKSIQGDEEELEKPYKDEGLLFLLKQRKRFPPNYSTLFDILQLGCIPVRWVRVLTFNIIKQLSPGIRYLQYQKQKHKHTMDLIDYLAKDPGYWDFIDKGRVPEGGSTVPRLHDALPPPITPNLSFTHRDGAAISTISTISNSKSSKTTRWDDSPLTLAAKMGLHEFVERILTVCPQSAAYLDAEGMNVLQVAIKHGHEKIVDIIATMTLGNNPILPSWLLSAIEKKTKNTILHFAAAKEVDADQAFALQMQFELQWFERVKKLVPKDLEHSRNQDEKTAQELFTETHKQIVKSGKDQLTEVGKTCSSLVAAVVFASSFSIPGDKDSHNNPIFVHKIPFKVFSHAYVIGLSCASTALVLFLSLITSSYKEQDFRRALPTNWTTGLRHRSLQFRVCYTLMHSYLILCQGIACASTPAVPNLDRELQLVYSYHLRKRKQILKISNKTLQSNRATGRTHSRFSPPLLPRLFQFQRYLPQRTRREIGRLAVYLFRVPNSAAFTHSSLPLSARQGTVSRLYKAVVLVVGS
ncbi:hypothetical protein LUZ61_010724 [Rhynchospora tenuis]|uniref:PGG domain-containing protein n=1 Tax=Rhynchospora tenuis TaxID=198213 RepID=A0AAD6EZM3_9POAL|nr:hypothetical protein LUZ61_010724 [Rhynchospora tenuis]